MAGMLFLHFEIVIGRMFPASVEHEKYADGQRNSGQYKVFHIEFANKIDDHCAEQNRQLRNNRPTRQQSEHDHNPAHDVRSGDVMKRQHAARKIAHRRKDVVQILAVADKGSAFEDQENTKRNS